MKERNRLCTIALLMIVVMASGASAASSWDHTSFSDGSDTNGVDDRYKADGYVDFGSSEHNEWVTGGD
jgi:DNA-binding transcriptional regulator of glucitol operon